MHRLDEQSLRRPEFAEGVPIVLGDGQAWQFPKPAVVLNPVFDDSLEATGFQSCARFGAEYDNLVESFLQAPLGSPERALRLATLAARLLARNYEIERGALGHLFPFGANDAENMAMWKALAELACGVFPKAEHSGDAPT
jgi:hypothetical protein